MVESGNFSLRSQGLNFLTSNIRECNLLVFIQQLHGLLRTGSTAVVLTCVYRERVLLPVKTRPGFDGVGGALARLVIPRFQQKTKQNRRAARFCGYIAFVFTPGMPKRTGKPNQHS